MHLKCIFESHFDMLSVRKKSFKRILQPKYFGTATEAAGGERRRKNKISYVCMKSGCQFEKRELHE